MNCGRNISTNNVLSSSARPYIQTLMVAFRALVSTRSEPILHSSLTTPRNRWTHHRRWRWQVSSHHSADAQAACQSCRSKIALSTDAQPIQPIQHFTASTRQSFILSCHLRSDNLWKAEIVIKMTFVVDVLDTRAHARKKNLWSSRVSHSSARTSSCCYPYLTTTGSLEGAS